MKREPFFALFGLAAGAAVAYGAAQFLKKKKNTAKTTSDLINDSFDDDFESDDMEAEKVHVNYKDEDHLIFCEESDLEHRIIQLENTINMRDLGGYTGLNGRKTKWGKVIRSEELNELSDNDVDYLKKIGLKHIFDFRDEKTAHKTPDRIPEGAEYHNLPSLTGMPLHPSTLNWEDPDPINDFFKCVYSYQVKERAHIYANVLKVLAENKTPILFHCTNGKDRTGFMAALILLVCGVPEETIISDYTLTNLTFDTACRRFTPHMVNDYGCDPHKIRDFFGVRPEWLKIQLDYIRDHYDSVDDYLLDNTDLTKADLDAIREVMLEPVIEEV